MQLLPTLICINPQSTVLDFALCIEIYIYLHTYSIMFEICEKNQKYIIGFKVSWITFNKTVKCLSAYIKYCKNYLFIILGSWIIDGSFYNKFYIPGSHVR